MATQGVSEELRARWYAAFQAFDKDGSGGIDANELTALMQSMRMVPQRGEVEAMIAAADHNGDRMISFQEFEWMMINSGRDKSVGFSHVVRRHIRMKDVAQLITTECTNFVDRFCREHMEAYRDLPAEGNLQAVEHAPAWHDIYRRFSEEAELTVQNALILWGVASQKSFDEDFLDVVQNGNLLDDFLKLTEYQPFLERMRMYTQNQVPLFQLQNDIPRPTTPHRHGQTERKLSTIDRELAELDARRNALLAERRRIIGCEVVPVTTTALKQDLEARRWREEVGFD